MYNHKQALFFFRFWYIKFFLVVSEKKHANPFACTIPSKVSFSFVFPLGSYLSFRWNSKYPLQTYVNSCFCPIPRDSLFSFVLDMWIGLSFFFTSKWKKARKYLWMWNPKPGLCFFCFFYGNLFPVHPHNTYQNIKD